jgi:tRNA(fMet)-specific endonuclease VapC
MGTTYLLDTNVVIYFLDSLLPEKSLDFIENALNETGSFISVITKIELLGWQAPSAGAILQVEKFVGDSFVIPLTDSIVDKAIEIRRFQKIKLPDAVIAATALVYDYTLVSRNDADFRRISDLKYLNPFTDI